MILKQLVENYSYNKVELISNIEEMFNQYDDYWQNEIYLEELDITNDINILWSELINEYVKYISDNESLDILYEIAYNNNIYYDYHKGIIEIKLDYVDDEEENSEECQFNDKLVNDITNFNLISDLKITYN